METEDTYYEELTDEQYNELDEAVRKKVVIRGGKRVRKNTLSQAEKDAGYKIVDGKKVKMSAMERLKRKKAAKKGARKAKGKRSLANAKRLRSIKKLNRR